MKNLLILKFLILLLFISSCKKTNQSIPLNDDLKNELPKESNVVCQLTETDNLFYDGEEEVIFTSTYTYNSSGKITKWQFNEDHSINFEYKDKLIKKTYTTTDDEDFIINYELDALGRINSEYSDDTLFEYSYNSDGYIIKIENHNEFESSSYNMVYEQGNLSKVNYLDNNNVENNIEINLVYSEELNQDHLDYSELSYGYPYMFNSQLNKYFGKRSKNLIASVAFGETMYDFEYKKDINGKINRIIMKEGSSLVMDLKLKYSCK